MLATFTAHASDITKTVRRSSAIHSMIETRCAPGALTRVVAFAGLDRHPFGLHRHADFPERGAGIGTGGREAQTVLVAQFFLQVVVNLVHRDLFGNFVEPAAGLARNALQDGLAVRPLVSAKAAAIALFALEIDGIDQGIGPLRRFDGFGKQRSAAVIHAIGEQDERLAALLRAHQFVAGEQDGIVHGGASAHGRRSISRVTSSAPTAAARKTPPAAGKANATTTRITT